MNLSRVLMYNFSTFLIVTKCNTKLNIFIFFDKSFTIYLLIVIVKIKKDIYMKKLILVSLLSSGLFANYLCDEAIKDMQKYATSSNKAYELKLFNKEETQRMFLKNELENVLLHCNLTDEQQKIVKGNLEKTIKRISTIRQGSH